MASKLGVDIGIEVFTGSFDAAGGAVHRGWNGAPFPRPRNMDSAAGALGEMIIEQTPGRSIVREDGLA